MFFNNIHTEEIEWQGRKLRLETGKIARQADGAVLAQYGETTVLAVVVASKKPNESVDFLPLTVIYSEKTYAAGRIPGGYFKREGRPTERETLISRLIDRPVRPLFAEHYCNETQVIATVLSHDGKNDPDIVAMIAVSAAIAISGVPVSTPLAAARVGLIDGDFVINPDSELMAQSKLDLIVAGTQKAVMMVESEAHQLSEEQMLHAVVKGHKAFQPVIQMIQKMADKAAKPAIEFATPDYSQTIEKLKKQITEKIKTAYQQADKTARVKLISELRQEVIEQWCQVEDGDAVAHKEVTTAFKKIEKEIVRDNILTKKIRIDGRKTDDVRQIDCQAGILPRVHGSALFTRGETQTLVVVTLGTSDDEQYVDALEGTFKRSFMLHYNFPSYSVGEVGRMGFTSRREVGHGKLAWRALNPLLLSKEEFPYTLRIVSEVTESNGSSSMATVCGSSIALMDAGIEFNGPVAGIAMGLIKEKDEFAVLSDILGDEDHLGDMDFKVAGTDKGITSLQMDIKIDGIDENIMKIALEQANQGRKHILAEMAKEIQKARSEFNPYVPRIETIKIPVDRIRDVIGSGGKVIRQLTEETNTKIDIEDDGSIKVASSDAQGIKDAMQRIKMLTSEPEEGEIYSGKVVKIMEFGAFVNFYGAKDGLVHVSQISNKRVEKVADILKEGQEVKVKFMGLDNRGKIRLTMKSIKQD